MHDPQSLHKYAYVHGDPIDGIDPTGEFSVGGALAGSMLGSTLNQLTAQAGQSLAASMGFDVFVDPIDILLSRDIGLLPTFVYDAIDAVTNFVVKNAGVLGYAIVTVVIGAAYVRGNTSIGGQIRRYQNRINYAAGRVASKLRIWSMVGKLDARTDILFRMNTALSNPPIGFDSKGIKKHERRLIEHLEETSPGRFRYYRAKEGDAVGLGDFVIVDMSDAGRGRAFAVELKENSKPSWTNQLNENGQKVLTDAGFGQVDLVEGTPEQVWTYIKENLTSDL